VTIDPPDNVTATDRVMVFTLGCELPAGQSATLLHQVIARAVREAVDPAQGFIVARSVEELPIEEVHARESAASHWNRSLLIEDALDEHNLRHPGDPLGPA
jgi:hypothetical protein